jgi:DNA-directed RNA polymerase subunit alpha
MRLAEMWCIIALDTAKLAQALLLNSPMLKKIDELNLSVRSYMCLKNDNIVYVGDLVQKTEADMLRTRNFGRKSLNEIKEVLVQMGLHLGMELPGWPPKNLEELVNRYEDGRTTAVA